MVPIFVTIKVNQVLSIFSPYSFLKSLKGNMNEAAVTNTASGRITKGWVYATKQEGWIVLSCTNNMCIRPNFFNLEGLKLGT